MAVFISRRHACDQVKLVHHSRGRNLGRKPTSRWGRYCRQVREQWFQARTGQLRVTEAELRFLTEELRRGKISPG
jgi:hypothetical protein